MLQGPLRPWVRQLHLWSAFVFGAVFVVAGLTGCVLAWMHDLDALLNPDLFHASAPQAVTPARAQAVIDSLSADPRYGRPSQIVLPQRPEEAYVASYRAAGPRTSGWTLDVTRQVMVDGHSLQVLGERNWGEVGVGRRLLMPTLFHLHRYLLAGEVGKTVTAVSGLALLVTSLLGLVLWWPGRKLKAWRQGLRISYGGSWKRLAQTAHRSIGFFSLPLLALLGFSGVYFNRPEWVVPTVRAVAPMSPPEKPSNREPKGQPIAPEQALAAAQALFPQGRLSRIALPAKPSVPYEIRLRQPGEVRKGDGNTRISVDAYSGAVLRVLDPLTGPAGDKFLGWMYPLHTGEAFGLPGRALISVSGLAPLLFLVSGLVMWLRRRPQRQPRLLSWRRPSAIAGSSAGPRG